MLVTVEVGFIAVNEIRKQPESKTKPTHYTLINMASEKFRGNAGSLNLEILDDQNFLIG